MYFVRLVDLPCTVKGFVRHNPDGSDTIVLNSRLNRETQMKAMMHEIDHIEHGDSGSELSIGEIEKERHAI